MLDKDEQPADRPRISRLKNLSPYWAANIHQFRIFFVVDDGKTFMPSLFMAFATSTNLSRAKFLSGELLPSPIRRRSPSDRWYLSLNLSRNSFSTSGSTKTSVPKFFTLNRPCSSGVTSLRMVFYDLDVKYACLPTMSGRFCGANFCLGRF